MLFPETKSRNRPPKLQVIVVDAPTGNRLYANVFVEGTSNEQVPILR